MGWGGGSSQAEDDSDDAPWPKRVTRASFRNIKGIPNQDAANKRCKESIIIGDEVKHKSKGKEAMDGCQTIKKQSDKVQHNLFLVCKFLYVLHLSTFFCSFPRPFSDFFHNLFFSMVQDLRKKGSTGRFMFIDSTLEQEQKKRKRSSNVSISRGCF